MLAVDIYTLTVPIEYSMYVRRYSFEIHGEGYIALADAFVAKYPTKYRKVEITPAPSRYENQIIYGDYEGELSDALSWTQGEEYQLIVWATKLADNEDDHLTSFRVNRVVN